MSDECGGMEEPAVKLEPPDTSSLDSASIVETESAGVDDVYSLEEEAIVKVEIDIEPTVIQPSDYVYMPQPCKQEPIEDTPAATSYSVESQTYCASDKSYSTISDQVDTRTASMDYNDSRTHCCNICNKYYKFRSQLKKHTRTHTGERPFKCEVCNKCFRTTSKLNQHSRIHTGERPYNCETCNKCYARRDYLIDHMTIHTGARPYRCEVCSKCFRVHSHLNSHMTTHKDERPYSCEICNKSFRSSSMLKQHSRTHTVERPYNCEVCNKCFRQRRILLRHMKTHR